MRISLTSILCSFPKIMNLFFTVFLTPLFFKFWGESYSIYVVLLSLIGFSSVLAQPLLIGYYHNKNADFPNSINLVLATYFIFFFFILFFPFFLYLRSLNYEILFIILGTLLPLLSGGLLIVRASYYFHNKLVFNAMLEALFLLMKLPLGYLLITQYSLYEISNYLIYFEIVCFIEITTLVIFAKDSVSLNINSIFLYLKRNLREIKGLAILAAVVFCEVLIGNYDRLLLAHVGQKSNLIVYSFSLSAASVLYIVPAQINTQSQGNYIKNVTKGVSILLKSDLISIFLVTAIPFTIFVLEGRWVIELWLGKVLENNQIEMVYKLSIIAMTGAILNSLSGPFNNYNISTRGYKVIGYITYFCLFFLIIFGTIASYFFGMIYLAWTLVVMQLIKLILNFLVAKHRL